MNDDQLHRLLRRYPARIWLPESFCRSVWARIEAGKSSRTLGAGLRLQGSSFLIWLARPLPAGLMVVLVLALGWVLGCWRYRAGEAADVRRDIKAISPPMQAKGEKVGETN